MTRRRWVVFSVALMVAGGAGTFLAGASDVLPAPAATAAMATVDGVLAAAPGRVEPLSEEVEVAAEIGGKLKAVLVRTGDVLQTGAVVAELENDAARAKVAVARAQLAHKEAALRRLVSGARPEERAEALARVRQAEAVMRNSKADLERRRALTQRGFTSTEEAERIERSYEVARAEAEVMQQRYALIVSPPREEDVAIASAETELARGQLAEAEARLAMTVIRAPMNGTVLRVHRRVGETVSDLRDTPILTLGDISLLRVRAEIDETDVAKARLGQRAYVTADAFASERFRGEVVQVGPSLGRKRIRTDMPGERLDRNVLEVLIQLDDRGRLLPGLRVDVFLVAQPGSAQAVAASQ